MNVCQGFVKNCLFFLAYFNINIGNRLLLSVAYVYVIFRLLKI